MTPELRWLSDPTVFAVNRLDAHSDHLCCRTLDEAESGLTSLRQSLDGAWRFAWSANPAARPADFWQPDADLSGFGTIRVPGHIELQGYGQLQYTNTLYPWDGRSCLRPPQVDWNDDPVGSYVKEFDLDESLRGQRICVSFQGVEQAMYLWCNGQFVGYAEDSFTPSEFDLTPYIQDENNRLCVEVYKRSSAAWIEDQDFFRFSGIFRSVYLYAKPKVHINDIWLKADLAADNTTGLLTPLVKLDRRRVGCPRRDRPRGLRRLRRPRRGRYDRDRGHPAVEPCCAGALPRRTDPARCRRRFAGGCALRHRLPPL